LYELQMTVQLVYAKRYKRESMQCTLEKSHALFRRAGQVMPYGVNGFATRNGEMFDQIAQFCPRFRHGIAHMK
jgi:hypothetical protein